MAMLGRAVGEHHMVTCGQEEGYCLGLTHTDMERTSGQEGRGLLTTRFTMVPQSKPAVMLASSPIHSTLPFINLKTFPPYKPSWKTVP